MDKKLCTKCNEIKPADKEHWYFRNDRPASGPCKQCRKKIALEQHYKDTEASKARMKRYREENPDKMREASKRWYENNADYMIEKSKQNYIANREERIAYERERRRSGVAAEQDRARRAADPDKYRQKSRRVRKKRETIDPEYRSRKAAANRAARISDPERFRGYDAKRYADPKGNLDRRVNASIRTCLRRKGGRKTSSKAQFLDWSIDDLMSHLEQLFEEGMSWGNMSEWHIDHIIPLSAVQYDSENDPAFKWVWALSNLAPLWATDNLEKLARTDWVLPDTYKNPKLREIYEDRDEYLLMFG